MSEVMHHSSTPGLQITLSDAALRHLVSHLEKNTAHCGVRLAVKKTGCSGYSYVVDYVKTPNIKDLAIPLSGDYLMYVDKESFLYLNKLHIDYVKQGLNSKLIFTNPNQTGQCGCGESFTVD